MRAFIVLCLVALASADKLGYNYRPVEHSSSGLSFTPGSGSGGHFGSSSNSAPSYASPEAAASYSSPSYSAPSELEKEYYSFSADENDFYDPAASEQVANSVKKGLRVVFIKGPENRGYEDAALALARQAAEQRTAIYVLNRQPDISDLANKLNADHNNRNNRPEVHFVKYRTPEDAANAQRQIQSQYDALGGSARSYNGGIAPALNFASSAPASVHYPQGSYGGNYGAASVPNTSYLPASILRSLRRLRV